MESEGIPYFLLMCQLDDKWDLIEAEYGLKGFAIVVKLYQKIYGAKGYYCEWTNEIELLFSRRVCGFPAGSNLVSEIVQAALKRNLFSQVLFDKYHILTSHGIQKHYVDVTKRRLNVKMKKEYLLLEVAQIPKNVDIIGKNVDRNEENVSRKSISKVKGSKEKKRRVKDSSSELDKVDSKPVAEEPLAGQLQLNMTPKETIPIITLPLNDKREYPIYESNLSEWTDLYPAVDILQQLRNMRGWLTSNPRKRKTIMGINDFITTWLCKEQDKGHSSIAAAKPEVKQSRFVNFEQRNWDFENLEQLERERRRKNHQSQNQEDKPITP